MSDGSMVDIQVEAGLLPEIYNALIQRIEMLQTVELITDGQSRRDARELSTALRVTASRILAKQNELMDAGLLGPKK